MWNGVCSTWTISVGRFYDGPLTGQLAEVFLAKPPRQIGTELESLIQDACILISHLLQRGMSIQDLSRSLSREGITPDAPAASLIGLIVETMRG